MEIKRSYTHINRHLYDNFFTRGLTTKWTIVMPSSILPLLGSGDFQEMIDIVKVRWLAAQKQTAKSQNKNFDPSYYKGQLDSIQAVASKKAKDNDNLAAFGIISDHFPIMLQIIVT